MLAGMILGAVLVIAALMLFNAGRFALRGERQFVGIAAAGLLVAAAVVSIVTGSLQDERETGARLPNSGIAVADLARASSALNGPRAMQQSASRVASVPSLIEGLERKLRSDPEDASGWALLAQSYAFVGSGELAENALVRAVELGLDETDLRRRVEGARRDPHDALSAGLAR